MNVFLSKILAAVVHGNDIDASGIHGNNVGPVVLSLSGLSLRRPSGRCDQPSGHVVSPSFPAQPNLQCLQLAACLQHILVKMGGDLNLKK